MWAGGNKNGGGAVVLFVGLWKSHEFNLLFIPLWRRRLWKFYEEMERDRGWRGLRETGGFGRVGEQLDRGRQQTVEVEREKVRDGEKTSKRWERIQ